LDILKHQSKVNVFSKFLEHRTLGSLENIGVLTSTVKCLGQQIMATQGYYMKL
jgi:hypothetical protein